MVINKVMQVKGKNMNLERFKSHYMLRPEQIIIIDRPFELDGEEIHILALTYKGNVYTLWVMDCLSEEMDESELMFDPLMRTNRDDFKRRKRADTRSLESLEIGEHVFEFNGYTIDSFHFQGSQSFHKLHYFIEQGIELSHWNNVSLKEMRLIAYKSSDSVELVNVNVQDEAIKLKFRSYHKKVEVFYKYRLKFNLDEPVELIYYNPFEEKEESFYVCGFETYTLEDYMASIEKHPKYKDIPREHIDRMIEVITEYFEDLKRRNSSLVLMTYEANRGLSFQLTDYLDKKVEISTGNSSSAMAFIFRPDEKNGVHGKRQFVASFQDVSNDKLDILEFELHSIVKLYSEWILII